ncbi:hypothetical protein H6F96_13530 [Microcoleus sp. FACHB-53]|nr:hypothetical protein [Microcoleus sp. FACHB-53]
MLRLERIGEECDRFLAKLLSYLGAALNDRTVQLDSDRSSHCDYHLLDKLR